MNVTGAPNISLNPDNFDFGGQYVGGVYTNTLIVSNIGTDDLEVSNITSDNENFTVDVDSFTVIPGEQYAVLVTYLPASVDIHEGIFTVSSNDPSGDVFVSMTGIGLTPPDISVDPEFLSADLYTGDIETQMLTISNDGGDDLEWLLTIDVNRTTSDDRNIGFYADESRIASNNDITDQWSDYIDNSQFNESLDGDSGDSRDLGDIISEYFIGINCCIPSMEWKNDNFYISTYFEETVWKYNLESGLTEVFLQPGFSIWGMVFVEDDLWISDDTGNVYGYDLDGNAIGSFSTPYSSSVALAWDGNYFIAYSSFENNLYQLDFTGSIIETFDAMSINNLETADFVWVPNHTSGELWIKSVGMYEPSSITQVSLQNGNVELINSFGTTDYPGYSIAHDGTDLWILEDSGAFLIQIDDGIEEQSILDWLSVFETSGTIPAGSSEDIQVTFDATDQNGGDYSADIVITSNDPDENPYTVPVTMSVTGAPGISLNPDSFYFGGQYVGGSYTDTLIVSNIGTDDLEVYSIDSDNESFIVESYTPVILTSMSNNDLVLPGSILPTGNKSNSEKLTSKSSTKSSVYKDRFNNSKLNTGMFINNENTLSTSSTTTSDSETNPNTRDVEPFTVAPGEDYVLLVTYLPAAVEIHEGTLTFSSNDPSGDVFVSVSGTGLTPPDIAVNPDSLIVDLYPGDIVSQNLIISNDGGDTLFWDGTIVDYGRDSFDSTSVQNFDVYTNNSTQHIFNVAGLSNTSDGFLTIGFIGDFGSGSEYLDVYINDSLFDSVNPSLECGLDGNFYYYEPNCELSYSMLDLSFMQLESWLSEGQFVVTIQNSNDVDFSCSEWYLIPDCDQHSVQLSFPTEDISDWISTDSESGTLASGESANIDVTFNAEAVDVGEYFADIVINSNDPDENPYTIQVTMSVLEPVIEPEIQQIWDIPEDQGGRVYIEFSNSFYDTDTLNRIPELYTIERLDEMADGVESWVTIQTGSAYGAETYIYEVSTLNDSTLTDSAMTAFRVIASLEEGVWASEIGYGYSVDNISPSVPELLSGTYSDGIVQLNWSNPIDDDFQYFSIFRDSQLIAYETENVYSDEPNSESDEVLYYVTATDINGNESDPSEEIMVNIPQSINQPIPLNALQVNLYSTNVVADDMSAGTIFDGVNLLITSDDGGNYYVPSFGVDQIGDLNPLEGYSAFLQGMDAATLSIEGIPLDPTSMIHLDGLQVNLMPYVPQDCMGTAEIFSGVEDRLLIISDDNGNYFVPSFGVMTLTEMCPSNGYEVFLQGMDDLEFQYPASDGLARVETAESKFWSDYAVNSVSTEYDIVRTGISHPIILTELNGMVELGDELVAYADGEVVGAAKIVDLEAPVVLSTWGSYTEYGANLPGYENGDAIELRLWSENEQTELLVVSDLDVSEFGNSPLSAGTAIAYNKLAIPTEFILSPAYPNPFNPTTTINFAIPAYTDVSISVYNLQGREVVSLANQSYDAGYHSVIWNADTHSSGVYFVKMVAGSYVNTQKLMLVK